MFRPKPASMSMITSPRLAVTRSLLWEQAAFQSQPVSAMMAGANMKSVNVTSTPTPQASAPSIMTMPTSR